MNRREIIRGMLAMPAVALAAKLNVPEYVEEEIREELVRDLNRTVVGFSDAKVFDNRPVWASVYGTAQIWADFVSDKLGVDSDNIGVKESCRRMAREMDDRLRRGQITEDQRVIVEMPQIQSVRRYGPRPNQVKFELAMGVEQKTGLFGTPEIRVGYLHGSRKLVDHNGREFA